MRSRPLTVVVAASLAALVLGAGGSAAPVPPCSGPQLAGNFLVVPGSAGAGSISYQLNVRHLSGPTCFVSGLPRIQLLNRLRRPLPTRVTPAFRPGLLAVRVVMRPGYGARAQARFSPDVPGAGEPVAGRNCERTSYFMRVTLGPGGATFLAPIKPATPVCEHGSMRFSALGPARA
ncbi:MAG: hypothetical protein ACM3QU_07445 [Verrucomicrobiota bacterium]